MPIEQIRTALLLALAVIVFLMWQAWQSDHRAPPSTTQNPPAHAAVGSKTAEAAAKSAAAPLDIPRAPGEKVAPSVAPKPATVTPAALPAITVRTDTMIATIDPRGGNLVRLALPKYPVSVNKPKTPYVLLDDTPARLFEAQSGLLGGDGAPNHHAPFTAERRSYTLKPGEKTLRVVLDSVAKGPVTFRKIYIFHRGSYVIDVDFQVVNHGSKPWVGRFYAQFLREEPVTKGGLFAIHSYTGGAYSTPGKPYEKVSFGDMKSSPLKLSTHGGWVAMLEHYFVGAWIPPKGEENYYFSRALSAKRFIIGVVGPQVTVPPGVSKTFGVRSFLGPKVPKELAAAAPNLDRTVDFGWLFFIAVPLFWLLEHIEALVGNWGVAIILLTMLIKLAFFQLSATSYKSMARMRKLQPRLQHLRERYGDDRQKLNQAMMQLYKTEKINPLGGCLPIAVQIPVFLSLYWMLLESVALRQAPFVLWIRDLSAPDPYFVLPILMGVSMFFQQRLNPAPADPLQAKVMMLLPVVFTAFFLWFPSGLVLYWLTNNILSIAQQWVITKRIVGKI